MRIIMQIYYILIKNAFTGDLNIFQKLHYYTEYANEPINRDFGQITVSHVACTQRDNKFSNLAKFEIITLSLSPSLSTPLQLDRINYVPEI